MSTPHTKTPWFLGDPELGIPEIFAHFSANDGCPFAQKMVVARAYSWTGKGVQLRKGGDPEGQRHNREMQAKRAAEAWANAVRIVTCINGCESIPNPAHLDDLITAVQGVIAGQKTTEDLSNALFNIGIKS